MSPETLATAPTSPPAKPLWAMALACLISIALHGEIWRAWQGMATEPLPEIKPPQVIEVALTHAAPSPAAPMATPAVPVALPPPAKALPAPPKPTPKPKPVAKPAEPKKAAPPKPTPVVPKATAPEADSLPRFTAPPAFNPAPATPVRANPTPAPSAAPPLVSAAYSAPGLKNPPTRYPKIAQMRQWEGTVTLKIKVLADGTAGDIQIVSGSGHEILDESAVEQVKEWHFIPAHRGDKTVEDWVSVPIVFKLKS